MSKLTKTMRVLTGIIIILHIILLGFCLGLLYEIPNGCVWKRIQGPFKALFISLCMSLGFHLSFVFCTQKCDVVTESTMYYFMNFIFSGTVMVCLFLTMVPLQQIYNYNNQTDAEKKANPDPDFDNCDINDANLYAGFFMGAGILFIMYVGAIIGIVGKMLVYGDDVKEADRAKRQAQEEFARAQQRQKLEKQKADSLTEANKYLGLTKKEEELADKYSSDYERQSQIHQTQVSKRKKSDRDNQSDSVSQAPTNPYRPPQPPMFGRQTKNPFGSGQQDSIGIGRPVGGHLPLDDDDDDGGPDELDVGDNDV